MTDFEKSDCWLCRVFGLGPLVRPQVDRFVSNKSVTVYFCSEFRRELEKGRLGLTPWLLEPTRTSRARHDCSRSLKLKGSQRWVTQHVQNYPVALPRRNEILRVVRQSSPSTIHFQCCISSFVASDASLPQKNS